MAVLVAAGWLVLAQGFPRSRVGRFCIDRVRTRPLLVPSSVPMRRQLKNTKSPSRESARARRPGRPYAACQRLAGVGSMFCWFFNVGVFAFVSLLCLVFVNVNVYLYVCMYAFVFVVLVYALICVFLFCTFRTKLSDGSPAQLVLIFAVCRCIRSCFV